MRTLARTRSARTGGTNRSRPNLLARKGEVVRNGLRSTSTRSAGVGTLADGRSEYLESRAWRRTDSREPRLTMTNAPPRTAQNTRIATISSTLMAWSGSGGASATIQGSRSLGDRRLTGNVARFGGGEQRGRQREAEELELLGGIGADAGRLQCAQNTIVLVHTVAPERKDLLHADDVLLHADQLGDVGNAAGAVTQARQLDDQVDGRGDLLADRLGGQVQVGHQHHVLDAADGVARGVGVNRRQRAIVAGVHRLQHVERLAAAALADDDAVGTHAQGVLDQIPLGDEPLAFDVDGPGLETDPVLLGQLQLGWILDGDDPLPGRDIRGQHIEKGRLAGTGASGNEDVQLAADAG